MHLVGYFYEDNREARSLEHKVVLQYFGLSNAFLDIYCQSFVFILLSIHFYVHIGLHSHTLAFLL
jgi:hypothetical protein